MGASRALVLGWWLLTKGALAMLVMGAGGERWWLVVVGATDECF